MGGGRDAVTGAFGFTGRAIAAALLNEGRDVVTLSRRNPRGDPLAARIAVEPLDFTRPDRLIEALAGVETLYNTYWLRFPRGDMGYERAVEQSAILLGAARQAGVARVVHVSVVNASLDGPTPYVRAKARLEAVVASCGVPASIVRPTLTFGPGDILVNNLAWALRRLPVYGIPGDGQYPIQPVHVDDVARICLEAAQAEPGTTIDAAGPDTLSYREMVEIVRGAVGSRSLVVAMPSIMVLAAARVLGLVVRDVVLTSDEILELSSGFLASRAAPLGRIGFAGLGPRECRGDRPTLVQRAVPQLPDRRPTSALITALGSPGVARKQKGCTLRARLPPAGMATNEDLDDRRQDSGAPAGARVDAQAQGHLPPRQDSHAASHPTRPGRR